MATTFSKTVTARISQLAMTTDQWNTGDKKLLPGEIGIEIISTGSGTNASYASDYKVKVGPASQATDGTLWSDCPYVKVPVVTNWSDAASTTINQKTPLSATLGNDLYKLITEGDIDWKVLVNQPTHNFPKDFDYKNGTWKSDFTEYDTSTANGAWKFYGATDVAPIHSPHFSGTPTSPTPTDLYSGDGSTSIATTAYVIGAMKDFLEASSAMIFKGTIGPNEEVKALPDEHSTGDVYVVSESSNTYAGQVCEPGDMIICKSDTLTGDAAWSVIQVNINGAVTGPSSSHDNYLAVFNGSTGKIIKEAAVTVNESNINGYKIGSDVTYNESLDENGDVVGTHGLITAEKAYKLDHLKDQDISVASGGTTGTILQKTAGKVGASSVNIADVLTRNDYILVTCELPDTPTTT